MPLPWPKAAKLIGPGNIMVLGDSGGTSTNSAGGHCHGKRLSAKQALVAGPFHTAAVAACHCFIAFALKRRSVRREMR
jgi:hypothetical protein